jgi:prefoldin beta subunit
MRVLTRTVLASCCADHGKMVQTQSKLVGQHNENDMVLKELNLLEDSANVYKLVGPVLLKQDLDEAKSNVEKRLQYIGDEM